jgi:hypothetical protein
MAQAEGRAVAAGRGGAARWRRSGGKGPGGGVCSRHRWAGGVREEAGMRCGCIPDEVVVVGSGEVVEAVGEGHGKASVDCGSP